MEIFVVKMTTMVLLVQFLERSLDGRISIFENTGALHSPVSAHEQDKSDDIHVQGNKVRKNNIVSGA